MNLDEACTLFERSLTRRNDVGLLAEQYDPHRGQLTGNFPQALSHLALGGFLLAAGIILVVVRARHARRPGRDSARHYQ